ncbi:unnamed protein product [Cunninghamella blakesleeana]
MDIPNEIFFLIFQKFTSIHDLHNCFLVNKQWYSIARDPLFYKEIYIYSDNQFLLFINTVINMKYGDKRMSHYVKKITMHEDVIMGAEKIAHFQQHFPNITSMNYSTLVPIYCMIKYKIIGRWKHLTRLPNLYEDPTIDCLQYYKNTLSTLYLRLSEADCEKLTATVATTFATRRERRRRRERISLALNSENGKLSPELEYIPNLSSLKELYLDNDCCNCYNNISFFILDLIHSICPQVNTLTIEHGFNFEENKDRILILSSPSPSLSLFTNHPFRPWNNITTLCFKDISAPDPLFFTYIAHSYPHLESLTLDMNDRFMFSFGTGNFDREPAIQNESIDIEYNKVYFYRQAIEKMVLQLSHQLKKLHFTFKIPHIVWPNNKILYHLHLHSSTLQLKDLKWPLTIYPCRIERREYDDHYVSLCNEKKIMKPMGFLNRLEKLHLAIPNSGTDTLAYLLDNSHPSTTFSLSNLKELTVERIVDEDEKPPFYIYDWLDAFPNIQSLTIIKMKIVTKETFDNNIKEKEEKEEIAKQIKTQSYYKLKKLVIEESEVRLEGGLSQLCQYCPKLNHLECNISKYIHNDSSNHMKEDIMKKIKTNYPFFNHYYVLIYAPHNTFETLIIKELTVYRDDKPVECECLLLTKNNKMAPQPSMFIEKEDDDEDFEICNDAIVVYTNNIINCYFRYSWILF